MTGTFAFYVSQKDIDHGYPGVPNECPIALALNRLTGECVRVGSTVVAIGDAIYILSAKGQAFVKNFDNREFVYPQEFVLTPESL